MVWPGSSRSPLPSVRGSPGHSQGDWGITHGHMRMLTRASRRLANTHSTTVRSWLHHTQRRTIVASITRRSTTEHGRSFAESHVHSTTHTRNCSRYFQRKWRCEARPEQRMQKCDDSVCTSADVRQRGCARAGQVSVPCSCSLVAT